MHRNTPHSPPFPHAGSGGTQTKKGPVHTERLLPASVCFFSPVFLFSRPVYTERLLYASVDKSRRPASATLTAHGHGEGWTGAH